MKITYLIWQTDGSRFMNSVPLDEIPLIQVSGEEWYNIVSENEKLPEDQRRYFIKDIIEEGDDFDILVFEVTQEEYKEWRRNRQKEWRKHLLSQSYSFYSLYDKLGHENDDKTILETHVANLGAENDYFSKHLLEDLISSLEEWRPWGKELLARYMKGGRRSSTHWLANCCGVSEQTARRYKKEFEQFIKSFLQKISR